MPTRRRLDDAACPDKKTFRISLTGRVQGVGFRPTVCRTAKELGLEGEVRNFGTSAEILCSADSERIKVFTEKLRRLPPPVKVESIDAEEVAPRSFTGFHPAESTGKPHLSVLPADIGVCGECLRELAEKGNARYRYPFISCAQCGPRYTIIRKLPYDRGGTTMDVFPMCGLCREQYSSLKDRRCYGQTLSCPDCGPQLTGIRRDGARTEKEAAVLDARGLLEQGAILAVKAVGGFNLVCRADRADSVTALRRLKHRPTKPFAVLFANLTELSSACLVSSLERELLCSAARPIVLLDRSPKWRRSVCDEVAGAYGLLGAFLPAVGLYAMLAENLPLVVTSCNRSGTPILFRDSDMREYFLSHDAVSGVFWNRREILRPADDSVARAVCGAPQILRRTRGYEPEPAVTNAPSGNLLALGAQLEPALCLASGGRIYPVAVPGDLDELSTRSLLKDTIADLSSLLNIRPESVVCDKHPLYYTTGLAHTLGLKCVQVQHHYAHAMSVIAEHGLKGKVLAVCFDGTGYGDNGSVWGGEFLLCDGASYSRAGHLAEIPMIGGDISMKQGWKSALCHLEYAGLESSDPRFPVVRAALRCGVNTIRSSSMGRLFDAVSAVLGLCRENTHQGRCAVACENAAAAALIAGEAPLQMAFSESGGVFDPSPLFPVLLSAKDAKTAALGFHRAVIRMVVQMAKEVGAEQVALCGGVFANRILLEGCRSELEKRGFSVYWNRSVPPGDGGISLGQAYYGLLKG